MIKVNNLSKSYSTQEVLENISFTLSKRERVGLIGRNGSGKSTLFKMILGLESSDSGNIQVPKYYKISSLSQTIEFTKETVLEECCQSLAENEQHNFYKAEKILFGLGLTQNDLTKSPNSFSGGFQVRICLAKVLLESPNLLLLDEPTNYLDIVSLRWLEKFLKNFPGELIIITHDKTFMDNVCTHIMGITRKSVKKIKGVTKDYYQQIQLEDENYEQTRLNHEKKKQELEQFVTRFKAKASKAKQAQSRVKQLEKMGNFDKLSDEQLLGFNFPYSECPAKMIMSVKNLDFSYDQNNLNELLIKNFSLNIQRNDRIGIIGKNGKGKSTLLNLLANELKSINGEINSHPSTSIGHFGQTNINRLNFNNSIAEEIYSTNNILSQTQVRSICGTMMFSGILADKKINILSGGEKSRVLIGKLLAKKTNVLMLDEPTNHLDMQSIDSLCQEVKNYSGAILVVTHNEFLLRSVVNKLIVFHKNTIELFDGNYDEFLEKVGWEEELAQNGKEEKKPLLSKKEYKKARALIIEERGKELTPYKKEISILETEIQENEEESKRITQLLINASGESDSNAILKLSSQVQDLEEKIEQKFSKLETITEKHELIFNDYKLKLEQLESKL